MTKYARLLFPLPFRECFEYICTESRIYACGDIVLAPFGNQVLPGVVWEITTSRSGNIEDVHDTAETEPKPSENNAPLEVQTSSPHRETQLSLFLEEEKGVEAFSKTPCKHPDPLKKLHKLRDQAFDSSPQAPQLSHSQRPLKALGEVLVKQAYSSSMRQFIDWVSAYTCMPVGSVLKLSLNRRLVLKPKPQKACYTLEKSVKPEEQIRIITVARRRVLEVLKVAEQPLLLSELQERAKVGIHVIKALVQSHVIRKEMKNVDPGFKKPVLGVRPLALTEAQKEAVAECLFYFEAQKPVLLDGVTGSGKTEVYFELIEKVLEQDSHAQCLILLPEIALTPALLERLSERFQVEPTQWHSSLTEAQRQRSWQGVLSGEAQFVVGARSALFLPFQNLQILIVDEEHDASYKQEEGVCYQGRDLAVLRAKQENCKLVLASATPAMETIHNARLGRYGHVQLHARPGTAVLPEVKIINLQKHPPKWGSWLSPVLVEAMRDVFTRQEQVLLFLNRRGYAPLVVCSACGERLKSPNTDSWLSEHKKTGRLLCHRTGFSMPKPKHCPYCQAQDSLRPVGPGVERIAEEVAILFPTKQICILSSDMLSSVAEMQKSLDKISRGEIDIIVGTQIIAKGHNFPALTLVGVIDADLGLQGGDLRATERTYQLMTQVAGRSGRAEKRGTAFLQTYTPEHSAFQALVTRDREAFIEAELAERKFLDLPPFGRLAMLTLSGKSEQKVLETAKQIAQKIPETKGIEVLGPAEPVIVQLRGNFRQRFLLRSQKNQDLSGYLRFWWKQMKIPSSLKVQIDVEPYSFL